MYMDMSHCLQPENQVIKRQKSGENLRSNCKRKYKKNVKLNKALLWPPPLNTYYIARRLRDFFKLSEGDR